MDNYRNLADAEIGWPPAPRESLPACIRRVMIFDGLQVCWHDMERCFSPVPVDARHVVTAGRCSGIRADPDCSQGRVRCIVGSFRPTVITDSESEAATSFERALDWAHSVAAGEEEDG